MSGGFFGGLTLNSITSALTAAGVSATSISGVVSGLVSGSVASQAQPFLNTIVANATNPAVVQMEILKIEEIQGLPASVVPLLTEMLTNPGDALKVQQLAAAITSTLVA